MPLNLYGKTLNLNGQENPGDLPVYAGMHVARIGGSAASGGIQDSVPWEQASPEEQQAYINHVTGNYSTPTSLDQIYQQQRQISAQDQSKGFGGFMDKAGAVGMKVAPLVAAAFGGAGMMGLAGEGAGAASLVEDGLYGMSGAGDVGAGGWDALSGSLGDGLSTGATSSLGTGGVAGGLGSGVTAGAGGGAATGSGGSIWDTIGKAFSPSGSLDSALGNKLVGGLVSGVTSGLLAKNMFNQTGNMKTASNLSNNAFSDPNAWQNQSWIKSLIDYNQAQTQAKMASQGYNMSGNTPIEMMRAGVQTGASAVPAWLSGLSGNLQAQTGAANAGTSNATQGGNLINTGLGNLFSGTNMNQGGSNTSLSGLFKNADGSTAGVGNGWNTNPGDWGGL